METTKLNRTKAFSSIIVSLIFIAFAFATTESETSNTTSESTSSNQSIEYKLAVVDGNSTPSDETIRRYGCALDLLERYCTESRQEIADLTVRGQQILQEENVDESLINLLQNFRNSIPEEAEPCEAGDCRSIFSSYITLRVQ